jgi:hypothetical protein
MEGLQAGNYTVELRGSGYLTTHFGVVCVGDLETPDQDATITPILPPGQTRIVLTWGAAPPDLDSHTSGPLPDGSRFHMYYPYAEANSGSPWPIYVTLDLDDVSSYGPETTTILQQIPGVYRFLVHDYVNRFSTNSTALSGSGAVVRVYREQGLVASFPVPTGQGGTLWTVFEMDGDQIVPKNELGYASNPGGILAAGPEDQFDWSNLPLKEQMQSAPDAVQANRRRPVSAVATGASEDLPLAFSLHPLAPNPVASWNTIQFDLPVAAQVHLELYDVQGRRIRTLAGYEQKPAGRHVVSWDGRSDRGEALQPGIYFVRLEAGDYRAVRRAIVAR